MASLARTVPHRIGQSAARIRASSSLTSRLQPSASWVCNRCAYKAVAATTQRRSISQNRTSSENKYDALDTFPRRHIGPDEADTVEMLKSLSPPAKSLDQFVEQVVPPNILTTKSYTFDFPSKNESQLKSFIKAFQKDITMKRSFIGQGYYGTITPPVIQRNVLENPAWYTSYTPYQPEISQGRLESLLNFQTMVTDLTSLPIANASLLDEGTAAAEALTLSLNTLPTTRAQAEGKTFVVSTTLHPQTLSVLHGRADGFGVKIKSLDLTMPSSIDFIKKLGPQLVGVMVQYPDTYGQVHDYEPLAEIVHEQGALLSVATDLLALTMLKPPGEWGADIAFGSAQRFGVPMGFGGPHAAFFAVKDKYKRKMPGRLVGISKDRLGDKAYRLALQTREQHIRREKATSNVCTSQALLANMSALYAIYHGPEGLKAIAERVIRGARVVQAIAEDFSEPDERNEWPSEPDETNERPQNTDVLFDTVIVDLGDPGRRQRFVTSIETRGFMHVREIGEQQIGISIDETTTLTDLVRIFQAFESCSCISPVSSFDGATKKIQQILRRYDGPLDIPARFRRTSSFLTHPVFNTHHSETEMLRYIHHLESKDLSLVHSMIPLGSCTMKLNGTTEMSLITIPEFSQLHPYTPRKYVMGYRALLDEFKRQLSLITHMEAVSLQPNSGAQGEFAGLRTITEYHKKHSPGQKRDICLIPVSAHGTNPASAAMAGMRVVPIKCDTSTGNLDLEDLRNKCKKHRDELGAIMVTYPSTFGVFEPKIKKVCDIVHQHGGLVYMDGANMNAQIGLCSPGQIGADVCHLNLHKTFCIPHGGGGPGVGPICVRKHLAKFLPRDPYPEKNVTEVQSEPKGYSVSSANYGSASINLISWAYNCLMGSEGLTHATKITLLNANYILSRLKPHYEILYVNDRGRCAHEFILDTRPFHKSASIEAIDIAKRLQDYGFHAPTMSWPVANTLMIEPTESESKEELDRFVDALISIREEIREIEEGKVPREGNVLKMAPHSMQDLIKGDGEDGAKWERVYSREKAAYPLPWLKEKKFWPTVTRINDTYGDTHLFCTCPPVEDTTSS